MYKHINKLEQIYGFYVKPANLILSDLRLGSISVKLLPIENEIMYI